jgi:single-strand DNA-binding protein
MASLNKVILIGNAGRDAELRYLANGTAQASFSLAVNRNQRGADGEWQQETDWFNIVAWRDLAERISQQVTKGKQIYVEGRLQQRSWDNDQGVKQTRIEVVANSILLLGRNEAGPGGGAGTWGDDAPAAAGGAAAAGGGWNSGNRPTGGARPAAGRPANGGGFAGGDVDPDDLPFE